MAILSTPRSRGTLSDYLESRGTNVNLDRPHIERLLDTLPGLMEAQPDGNRVAAGSAIKGVLAGLVSCGRYRRGCAAHFFPAHGRWADQPLFVIFADVRSWQAANARRPDTI